MRATLIDLACGPGAAACRQFSSWPAPGLSVIVAHHLCGIESAQQQIRPRRDCGLMKPPAYRGFSGIHASARGTPSAVLRRRPAGWQSTLAEVARPPAAPFASLHRRLTIRLACASRSANPTGQSGQATLASFAAKSGRPARDLRDRRRNPDGGGTPPAIGGAAGSPDCGSTDGDQAAEV